MTREPKPRSGGRRIGGMVSSRFRVNAPAATGDGRGRGTRLVALSDLHAPPYQLADGGLVRRINQLAPDLFMLVGDIVCRAGHESVVRAFAEVDARLAKLAVLGNWEYGCGLDRRRLEHEYAAAGVQLLVNASATVGGLEVVGLDDWLMGHADGSLVDGAAEAPPALVMCHCPKAFDELTHRSGNVLMLSGHTHGGQIAPFGFAPVRPAGSGRYVRGWYHHGKRALYVMRGIGTSTVPIRIGARPELLVIDIVGRAETWQLAK